MNPASTSTFSRFAFSKSASTIIATSCLNCTLGCHPNTSFALAAEPRKLSTSEGRKYLTNQASHHPLNNGSS
jgi:hypothetical protein